MTSAAIGGRQGNGTGAGLRLGPFVKRVALGLALVATAIGAAGQANADGPSPVLMVIANQDFWYQDYSDTRASLEAAGLEVVVAASTTDTAISGSGRDGGFVAPDLALADVEAEDYSAIVFVGGWGAASYQYAFEGTYHDAVYRIDRHAASAANRVINGMLRLDRPVAAIAHGVSVLAWARVDGVSPLRGRVVVGSAKLSPSFDLGGKARAQVPSRWHVEVNGGVMLVSGAAGDPQTSADDVIVDGNIITAENFDSASLFARTLREAVRN